MNVTVSERQLRALANLVRYYPSMGTRYPCSATPRDSFELTPTEKDECFLTASEMADLDRRFQDVLNPLVQGSETVTVAS